ncbi:MAG: hypothetical protein QNL04_02035 [SAR324 cluster bacterium]|nr:hypothetical protein [SAR324 cluster bacterium]
MDKEVTQLDDLLKRLQTEGVDKAKTEADKILKSAQLQAEAIVQDAEKKAKELQAQVQLKLNNKQDSDQKRLRLAARDLTLKLTEDLKSKFTKFLEKNCYQSLDLELLKSAIKEIAASIHGDEKIELHLSKADRQKLTGELLGSFAQEIKQKIILKEKEGLSSGFEMSIEGEARYFDFTPERIALEIIDLLGRELSDLLTPFAGEGDS